MKQIHLKIGFVGAGNMAEAMAGALVKSGRADPRCLYVNDINKKRLAVFSKDYGIQGINDNGRLFRECDIIILAVKPQQMHPVLSEIAGTHNRLSRKKLIISIAAGFPLKKLEKHLYASLDEKFRKRLPIIRVMPNTPALVRSGISGMSANKFASRTDVKNARIILEAAGEVVEFREKDLDAVTALSGSGPAYVFYLAESMIAGGKAAGLTLKHSEKLTLATLKGAVKLMEESRDSAETLRKKVTSPGGTTEAALRVFHKGKVKNHIVHAIAAAAKRAKELRNLQ